MFLFTKMFSGGKHFATLKKKYRFVNYRLTDKTTIEISIKSKETKYKKYFFGDILSTDFWQKL